MRLLVVEDHPALGPDLKKGLERCHYLVDLVTNGEDALARESDVPYDLIILDILLPGLDGREVCRRLREMHQQVPILFLTALGTVDDRIQGLDLGADDYLSKPFDFRELEARVRALLRRNSSTRTPVLSFQDITLDTRTHEARRGERLIALSSKEYTLLHFFMSHPREILSRTTIAEHVWDYDAEQFSNVIEVYVRYLRNKLCAAGEPNLIQTVRGSGYQLKEPIQ
ncbi:response regulator transcription factor [Dictyobacter kobayashii]|uniref:DNA-binding response regulator n=1 Tax=Dictyobacter kobayashii TaxID=2014872 RepID=A0A402AGP1_9CHLR|nr:response regulator transcription factor [Dictyobacter kobayashii]GCE18233.1 DNA-binding response regulator [Dictyobacter kobayashii]